MSDPEPISYEELEKLWEDCNMFRESDRACMHEHARVVQDGNAITVHCGHCGLYGVMAVETAKLLGWIQ